MDTVPVGLIFFIRVFIPILIWSVIYLIVFVVYSHIKKTQNLARAKLFLKSLMIFLAILLVAYTIFFIYYEIFILPVEYMTMDGKRAPVQASTLYCSQWSGGVDQCGVIGLVFEYFEMALYVIVLIPYFFQIYPVHMIWVFLIATLSTIYFHTKYQDE
jgi:hypothetical protein